MGIALESRLFSRTIPSECFLLSAIVQHYSFVNRRAALLI